MSNALLGDRRQPCRGSIRSPREAIAAVLLVAVIGCGGNSSTSNNKAQVPAAPTGLVASAASSSQVDLVWNDNANDETGFKVEQAPGGSNAFTEVVTVGTDVTGYQRTGLNPATSYSFRVRAFNTDGSSSYSNIATATTPAGPPTDYTLTVARGGTGTGTVTGTGINCGTTCSTTVASGTSITLTASPSAGSSFAGWTNCDTPSGTTCTMSMTANKTVTATFASIPVGALTVAVPTSSTTGSYNVTVDCSGGVCSTTVYLQEDTNTQFSNPTQTTYSNVSYPLVIAKSGKANGTYCYRAGSTVGNWSAAVCITVTIAPQTVTLKPQYDNLVMINSQDNTTANTVYPSSTLAVGCNWIYSIILSYQDFVCGESLMRFDLTALAGKTIVSAQLKLTVNSVGVGNYPRNWHVWALASNWSPSTVTWNQAVGFFHYTSSTIVQSPPTRSGQIYNLDLTTFVKNWTGNIWTNNGVVLGSEDYSFPNATSLDAFDFFSLEDPGREWPTLTITYQ